MPRSNISCDKCGKSFYKKPSQITRSKKNFCSIECVSRSRKTGKMISCFICGERAYKQAKDLNRNQSGKFFCSKKCSTAWQNTEFVGEKHPNWIHGKSGYRDRLQKIKKISKECILCGEDDFRVLIVHHVDENRKNNKISNLAWLCNNCHFLVHNYKKEKEKLTRRIC